MQRAARKSSDFLVNFAVNHIDTNGLVNFGDEESVHESDERIKSREPQSSTVGVAVRVDRNDQTWRRRSPPLRMGGRNGLVIRHGRDGRLQVRDLRDGEEIGEAGRVTRDALDRHLCRELVERFVDRAPASTKRFDEA